MTRFRRKSAALNLVRIIPVWHTIRAVYLQRLSAKEAHFIKKQPHSFGHMRPCGGKENGRREERKSREKVYNLFDMC